MKRSTKRATIALDLVKLDTPRLVSFVRAISKGLTNNPNLAPADVAKLPVTVAAFEAAATTLESTHTTRATAPSKANTKLERDQSNTLLEHVTNVAAFVEGVANTKGGDLTTAESIIVSVGFSLKKTGVKHRKGFAVTSPAQGTAEIHFPAEAKGAVRLVQYSGDGGKTWSTALVVHGVKMTITGLKSAVDYFFRYGVSVPPGKKSKAMVAAGSEEPTWSDPVSRVIS